MINDLSLKVDRFLNENLKKDYLLDYEASRKLFDSAAYSTLDGGKRFRPVLSLMVAEALEKTAETCLAFSAALEMIHCFSLIHDDLPCMDDDDFRRGKPSNHKVYGEGLALLAGDALLNQAYQTLAFHYREHPKLADIVIELSEAVGGRGMIGGQALDLAAQEHTPKQSELLDLHKMKTGALIRVSVTGAALLCSANEEQYQALKTYGENLGLAFQIADDLQEWQEGKKENWSFPAVLGEQESWDYLEKISQEAESSVQSAVPKAKALIELIHFNKTRTN